MALLIPFFILAAFFLLRANPQRRRVQAQKAMIESLRPGAHVVTVAGVIGTVVGVEGDRVAIKAGRNQDGNAGAHSGGSPDAGPPPVPR